MHVPDYSPLFTDVKVKVKPRRSGETANETDKRAMNKKIALTICSECGQQNLYNFSEKNNRENGKKC